MLVAMAYKDDVHFLCKCIVLIPIGNPYNEKKKLREYIQKMLGVGQNFVQSLCFSFMYLFFFFGVKISGLWKYS